MLPFDVTADDISRIQAHDLTTLLRYLLAHEAEAHSIPKLNLEVGWNITVADGGEDGSIRWAAGPPSTSWLPSRDILFQVKATTMDVNECKREVLERRRPRKPPVLKSKVKALLDRGGSYVLFCRQSYTGVEKDRRIAAIRAAFSPHPSASTTEIRILDGAQIALWCAESATALSFVLGRTGRLPANAWRSWSDVQSDHEHQISYVGSPETDTYLAQLRVTLLEPRIVVRLIGPSGVGKTRLAMEAFRPNGSINQRVLSDRAVFVDGANNDQIIEQIRSWRLAGVTGVLIVDECDESLHHRLLAEVRHLESRFALLTIDFAQEDPDKTCRYIKLGVSTERTLREMVTRGYGELPIGLADRIVDYAHGFPRIVAQLQDTDVSTVQLDGREDLHLQRRLLWGRETPSPDGERLICCCAIFDRVGWIDDVSNERDVVAVLARMTPDEAYRLGEIFRRRGVHYERGRYRLVTPPPVAMALAAKWLEGLPASRAVAILTGLPPSMREALGRQMAQMYWHPTAKRVVEEVCRPGSPFDSLELLDSEVGARLMFEFSVVAPEAVMSLLWRQLATLSDPAALAFAQGRRRIIWTLERLCFWPETFERAATLMLMLAANENESWGNNATHQFGQLFQVYLSGTRAPPEMRLRVADAGLDSGSPTRIQVVIKALGHALEGRNWSRVGQSPGDLRGEKDWEPTTYGERRDYWRAIAQRLLAMATGNGISADLAADSIAARFRHLISQGLFDVVVTCVTTLVDRGRRGWTKAIEELRSARRFQRDAMTNDQLEEIDRLIRMLEPTALLDRLAWIVSTPPFEHQPDDTGRFFDIGEQRAIALADELLSTGQDITSLLPHILTGEQRQAWNFGARLGARFPAPLILLDAALDALRSAPDPRNPGVAIGMAVAINRAHPKLVRRRLEVIAHDKLLAQWIVDFTAPLRPTAGDLKRIVSAVADGRVAVEAVRRLTMGSVLRHLPPALASKFAREIAATGSAAPMPALDVLVMYAWNDARRRDACASTLRRLLMTPGLLDHAVGDGDVFHIEQTLQHLLGVGDSELATGMSRAIVAWFEASDDAWLSRLGRRVLQLLAAAHPAETWNVVGPALVGTDGRLSHRLLLALQSNDGHENGGSVVSCIPNDVLLTWAATHHSAPHFLAAIAELEAHGQHPSFPSWTPLAISILDRWGADVGVLSEMSANKSTRGWVGSSVPLYRADITAYEELLHHSQPQVREWARQNIEFSKKMIERETQRDEEREIGIFR
jgi:hypothetical protein